MIIAGGTYVERCQYPKWDRLFGSGMRAAVGASGLSTGTVLHSYVPAAWQSDAEATLSSFGIAGKLEPTKHELVFEYLDTLQKTFIPPLPKPEEREKSLHVNGDVVLRFGMMEGDAVVSGRTVVYDPQYSSESFHENGSSADRLAMILSESELLDFGGLRRSNPPDKDDLARAAQNVFDQKPAPQIILTKDRLGGLTVFFGDDQKTIDSYAAESYFRIGAGDVLATAFAHAWGELRMDPVAAADYAARSIAYFVEGARLPLRPPAELSGLRLSRIHGSDLRLLGVGAFEVKSLIMQTESWISEFGGSVELVLVDWDSPIPTDRPIDLVIIGSHEDARTAEDIRRRAGNPEVVFWPGQDRRLTKHCFPRSRIADDYASALYQAMRSPPR
jgi:hypothetical protein